MVGFVGLKILELGLEVSSLGFVAGAAGRFELAAVLGDVGVDAFLVLIYAAKYS